MITPTDLALVLSNSGETPELSDIIAYTRRFHIPLIGMTRRPESSLATQSDYPLVLPNSPEACPNRQAPTTSTTAMLALGDAMAVALMARRGFSADDFRTFHPGGKLGARLAKVSDLMHTDLPLVPEATPMSEALLVMSQKGFGVIGALDAQGRLSGIVTDGDLRRHMDGLLQHTVAEVMTAKPRTITPEQLAEAAVAQMNDRKITSLFVVQDDRPVGFIQIHDCLRAGIV
jgi:arabinose-5-phosphate isomerase